MGWRTRTVVVQVPQEPTQSEAGRLFLDLLDPTCPASRKKWKAWELGELKDQQEAFLFTQRLTQLPEAVFREMAISALTGLFRNGSRDAERLLWQMTRDPEPRVRGSIATELGTSEDAEAQRLLVTLGKDSDPSVRSKVAGHLFPARSPEARDLLLALLQDESEEVRQQAASNIEWIEDDGAVPETFLALALDPSAGVRTRMADSLYYIQMDPARSLLLELARDPVPEVRAMALRSLQNFRGDDGVLDRWIEASEDPVDYVRAAATDGLRNCDHPEALECLLKCARDPCLSVRYNVARGIERNPVMKFLPVLLRLAEDEEGVNVRRSAARSLQSLPGTESEACLAGMLEDPSPLVRRTASKILSKWKGLGNISKSTALELKYGWKGLQSTKVAFRHRGRPSDKPWEQFLEKVDQFDGVRSGSSADRGYLLLETAAHALAGIIPFSPSEWLWVEIQPSRLGNTEPSLSYELLGQEFLLHRLAQRTGDRVLEGGALLKRMKTNE